MLVGSVGLLVAGVAYLVGRKHYSPFDADQDAYHRQRRIGEYGRLLAFAAATSSVIGWILWGKSSVWRRELLLAALLTAFAATMIIAFDDLPMLTQAPPQGRPEAHGPLAPTQPYGAIRLLLPTSQRTHSEGRVRVPRLFPNSRSEPNPT